MIAGLLPIFFTTYDGPTVFPAEKLVHLRFQLVEAQGSPPMRKL